MTTFQESLTKALEELRARKTALSQSWAKTRDEVTTVLGEAAQVLAKHGDVKYFHENGNSSTLQFRGHRLSFRYDEQKMKIIRVSSLSEVEGFYDPPTLTREKVEQEVHSFALNVLQGA